MTLIDQLTSAPFLRQADALSDDDRVLTARHRSERATDAVRQARRNYNALMRFSDTQPDTAAQAKRALEKARQDRTAEVDRMVAQATRLRADAASRADATLARYLDRPEGADPAADVLELQDERRRLAGMDPGARSVVVRGAAEANEHRTTVRAALARPRPGEDPLLPEPVATEASAWGVLHRAGPGVVRDLRAAQRLTTMATELDLSDYAIAVEG